MNKKNCQIVIVGHTPNKLTYSIDKELNDKIIFITEEKPLSGTKEAKITLKELLSYYKERRVKTESIKFNFEVQKKPISQLVHLILQQKISNYRNITINVSGGLRYISIWFYIGCCITQTRIIHGDFIYEGNKEVGINSNMELLTIPFDTLTKKQYEFMELFFDDFVSYEAFFDPNKTYNENILLSNTFQYNSLEELKIALGKKRGEEVSRGTINGFINKLNKISALNTFPNPKDRKEKSIKISHMGIAHFLNKIFSINR